MLKSNKAILPFVLINMYFYH